MKDGKIYYVMGVSGSGKSTIASGLAMKLNLPFLDGDDYHPESNVRKMAAGSPLTDADREQWLRKLNALARAHPEGAVIVCSALKARYRDILEGEISERVIWIFLEGTYELIMRRLQKRIGHFMPPGLLRSQFEALEVPENALRVSIHPSPARIVNSILNRLQP